MLILERRHCARILAWILDKRVRSDLVPVTPFCLLHPRKGRGKNVGTDITKSCPHRGPCPGTVLEYFYPWRYLGTDEKLAMFRLLPVPEDRARISSLSRWTLRMNDRRANAKCHRYLINLNAQS